LPFWSDVYPKNGPKIAQKWGKSALIAGKCTSEAHFPAIGIVYAAANEVALRRFTRSERTKLLGWVSMGRGNESLLAG
jgi:hypothetical protein